MAHEYAAVEDLMDRLGIPDGDTRENTLIQVVSAASRWVEDQLGGRRFYTVTETRYYTPEQRRYSDSGYTGLWGGFSGSVQSASWGLGWANQRVVIDDAISVTTVATDLDGDGTYETIWTAGTDYWVGPRNAPAKNQPYRTINRNLAVGTQVFPLWEDSLAVTGAFGYANSVPVEIREVTLAISELYARDVLEMSIPGVGTYSLGSDLKITMASESLPYVHREILQQYRDQQFLI